MTRYVTSARPDAQGRFSIASLPAGTYFAAVVAGPAPDDWAGPEFLAALRETGTTVRLRAADEGDGRARGEAIGPSADLTAGAGLVSTAISVPEAPDMDLATHPSHTRAGFAFTARFFAGVGRRGG